MGQASEKGPWVSECVGTARQGACGASPLEQGRMRGQLPGQCSHPKEAGLSWWGLAAASKQGGRQRGLPPSLTLCTQPKPENAITIAVSSRALFRMEEEQKIYNEQGVEAYVKYQLDHENEPFLPGAAFPFVKVSVCPHKLNPTHEFWGEGAPRGAAHAEGMGNEGRTHTASSADKPGEDVLLPGLGEC